MVDSSEPIRSQVATMPTVPPKVHLNALSGGQLLTVLGAATRVLLDSTRTEDIVIGEELTAQAQLRHLLDRGVFGHRRGARASGVTT